MIPSHSEAAIPTLPWHAIFWAASFIPFNAESSALSAPAEFDERTIGEARTVFVVDDEALIADSVTQILTQSGFIATAFYTASEAIERAQVECPDILVSDVLMPELNGVGLGIVIRARCPNTRIILFSGQAATVHLLSDAEREGHSFELLPKPIHPRELLKALQP